MVSKRLLLLALPLLGAAHSALAQNFPVTPATPTDFNKRNLGGSLGSSVAGVQAVKPRTITYHYIAVSEKRPFVSVEGKEITALLLAFEEGDPAKVERPFTLIREGKIRLLVEGKQKPSVIPLERLRPEDREFVQAVDATNQKAAAPKTIQGDPRDEDPEAAASESE